VFEEEQGLGAGGSRDDTRQDRVNVLQRRLGKNKVGYRHRLEKEK
jgi:hypothetical protein